MSRRVSTMSSAVVPTIFFSILAILPILAVGAVESRKSTSYHQVESYQITSLKESN
jgi:hypothetical protein